MKNTPIELPIKSVEYIIKGENAKKKKKNMLNR